MGQAISPIFIIGIILGYFILLIGLSYLTTRKDSGNQDFFLAGRQAPWLMVAIGMIGASLSGVTFISIPGAVGGSGLNKNFSYMQIVMGYLLGYAVIALVLLPIYYRLQLTSIYTYLNQRLGKEAYLTGASYFLVSRILGSALRLYLVAMVLQRFVFDALQIPFEVSVIITIVLIWLYTFRSGLKTIVYTDVLQTVIMLSCLVVTLFVIADSLDISFGVLAKRVMQSPYSQVFFWENIATDPNNFIKQFLGGALIAIVMGGLDEDMMKKNLSCRTLEESQKNVFLFSGVLVVVNFLFLFLGAALYIYAANIGLGLPERADQFFPDIAMRHLPLAGAVLFILGLVAAAYSSADSALAALTTSFCVDFLGFERGGVPAEKQNQTRRWVHVGFSIVLIVVIIVFRYFHNATLINQLLNIAGYTYGPLLGLFTFGITNTRQVNGKAVIVVCLLAPVISFIFDSIFQSLGKANLGFLILGLNGLLTYVGLFLFSKQEKEHEPYN